MNRNEAASYIAGFVGTDVAQTSAPTNLHVISGEVIGDSEDGKARVVLDGMAFSEDDNQSVELDTLGGLEDGDTVTILLSGESGKAQIPLGVGSVGSIDRIVTNVEKVNAAATTAHSVANAAQKIAEATGQYFWHDSEENDENEDAGGFGAHVTQVTQEEWKGGNHTGPNSLWNSLGMLFRDGLNNLLALVTGDIPGVAIYDGEGNEASNVVASFTSEGAVVGYESSSNVTIEPDGMTFHNYEGVDIGAVQSDAATVRSTGNMLIGPLDDGSDPIWGAATPGQPTTYQLTYPNVSSLVGFRIYLNIAVYTSGGYSSRYYGHNGIIDWPTGTVYEDDDVVVYVPATKPDVEENSRFLYRYLCLEIKDGSSATRAEFNMTYWVGATMVAIVYDMTAPTYRFGSGSASGNYAFSEGSGDASGHYSHAQNNGTVAASKDQTALGRFNESDGSGEYAVIVGNGTSDDKRSNALTVDWEGNVECGKVNGREVTTYALSKDGSTITLTGSDGSTSTVEDSDTTPGSGTTAQGSMTSVPTSSFTQIQSLTLQPGKYLVIVGCYAANNATGYRSWTWSSASSVTNQSLGHTHGMAAANQPIYTTFAQWQEVTAATNYRVFGWQNSGSALNMRSFVTYVKIA